MNYYLYDGGRLTNIGNLRFIQEKGYDNYYEYISDEYKNIRLSYTDECLEYLKSNLEEEILNCILFFKNNIFIVSYPNDRYIDVIANAIHEKAYLYFADKNVRDYNEYVNNLSKSDYDILTRLSELIGKDIIDSDLEYILVKNEFYIYFMYWNKSDTAPYKHGGIYDINNDKLRYLFQYQRYDYTAMIIRRGYEYGDNMLDKFIVKYDIRNSTMEVYDNDEIDNFDDILYIKEAKDECSEEDTYFISKYINNKYEPLEYLGMNPGVEPKKEFIRGNEYMVYKIDRPFTPGNCYAYSYNIYIGKDLNIYRNMYRIKSQENDRLPPDSEEFNELMKNYDFEKYNLLSESSLL